MWGRLRQLWKSAPVVGRASSGLPLPGMTAQPAGWWRDDSYEQLRNYQSWVYAAVNAIAQEVARQKPFLFINTGQAEHEQVPLAQNHPLVQLLERPTPWTTSWELWYLTVLYLELTGNCYWYAAPKRNGQPGELWIIPTPWVRILPDRHDFVRGYEVAAPGSAPEQFSPAEIIHLKYPNPLDVHYGLSPLQANALTIDANTELQKARYQSFLSGQRPGVVLQTEQALSDVAIRRLEEKIQSRFSGRDNWTRPMVLEQGLKASPWTLTPAEMDFLSSAKLGRDEIFALFRVPAPVAGIVENVGLGSEIWYGARAMFCEGTVQPKLDLIGQVLTKDLARRFGPNVTIAFPDCSPRNQDQRRADDELDARTGLRTFNEIRRSRGLRPYADGRFDLPIVKT